MKFNRREFLSSSGQAAVAATLFGASTASVSASASASVSASALSCDPLKDVPAPIELPSLEEGQPPHEPQPTGMPSDGRIGYAVIGLGHLALGQILPAFIQPKRAKVEALVSGDREKASRVAKMYDVPPANIYSYDNSDDSLRIPQFTWSTSCSRTRCTKNSSCARLARAITFCAKSRWRLRPKTRKR